MEIVDVNKCILLTFDNILYYHLVTLSSLSFWKMFIMPNNAQLDGILRCIVSAEVSSLWFVYSSLWKILQLSGTKNMSK